MIANAGESKSNAASHGEQTWFLEMLPEIRKQAKFAFRGFPVEAREELVQEVVATAYHMFVQLCRRGRTAVVYPTPLAQFSIKKVRAGRRIGSRRNSHDITSPCAFVAKRVVIGRLDRFNRRSGRWREVLVEDRTAGPAETAAARIDWAAWLRSLSRRQRAIACTLASGETTGAAARKFRISAARISQLRVWFREHWERFHGKTVVGRVACE